MHTQRKKIAILGSTGSIGESALRVARAMGDSIEITAVVANSKVERLAEQAREFHCRYALIHDESKYESLKKILPPETTALAGRDALCDLVKSKDVDLVLCAIVGTGGLLPCIEAAKTGKTIALASKEVMVMAGWLVTQLAETHGADIIPVDSEHSAIFQCLRAGQHNEVRRLLLTASGGPFRETPAEELLSITPARALQHPTWNMGPKVTLDSATLMNKALEMVEAHFLFRIPQEQIDVIIHPQSIVHSMVEFVDGALIAQMSVPDMAFPIQYSFTFPRRINSSLPRLDLAAVGSLSFERPDLSRFPSLEFARAAMRTGKTMPAVMNAANEVAVQRFRLGEIRFPDIWKVIDFTMNHHVCLEDSQLDAILNADSWARSFARSVKVQHNF